MNGAMTITRAAYEMAQREWKSMGAMRAYVVIIEAYGSRGGYVVTEHGGAQSRTLHRLHLCFLPLQGPSGDYMRQKQAPYLPHRNVSLYLTMEQEYA